MNAGRRLPWSRSRLLVEPLLEGRAAWPRPAEAVLAAISVLALGVLLLTSLTMLRLQTPVPLGDGWTFVVEYGRLVDGSFGPARWFAQVGEHRPVVPRAFAFLDLALGGRGAIHLVVTPLALACLALCLGAATVLGFRGRPGGARTAVLTAAVALALVFSPAGIETLAVPARMQFPLGWAAVAAAFAAMTLHRDGAVPGPRRAAAAMVLVLFAQACFAHAALAWPVLLVLGWRSGAPRPALGVITAVAVAATAAFYATYRTPGGWDAPGAVLADPFTAVRYFLGIIGSPVEPLGGAFAAAVLGAILLVCGVVLALRSRPGAQPSAVFFLAVLAFAGLAAVFTTLFRGWEGGSAGAASRNVIIAAPGLAAMFALWAGRAVERGPGADARPVFAVAAIVVLASVGIAARGLGEWQARLGDLSGPIDALYARVYDPEALDRMFAPTDRDALDRALTVLAGHDLSIFRGADASELLGLDIDESFTLSEATCLGYFDVVLDAQSATGAAVGGWAWTIAAERPARPVVIVDEAGVIVGVATTPIPRPDVLQAIADIKDQMVGWQGYARPTSEPARAFAVIADGVVCQLIGEFPIAPSANPANR